MLFLPIKSETLFHFFGIQTTVCVCLGCQRLKYDFSSYQWYGMSHTILNPDTLDCIIIAIEYITPNSRVRKLTVYVAELKRIME